MALASVVAVVLSGCGTLSERECLSVDWWTLGKQDGLEGWPASRLADHQSACADVARQPDPIQYEAGRQTGLLSYCTPESAYRAGRRGDPYRGVCPSASPAFFDAFDWGERYYDLAERIERLEQRLFELQWEEDDRPRAGDYASKDAYHRALDAYHRRERRRRDRRFALEDEIFRLEIRQERYDRWPPAD